MYIGPHKKEIKSILQLISVVPHGSCHPMHIKGSISLLFKKITEELIYYTILFTCISSSDIFS
jgi:hypothetical protein